MKKILSVFLLFLSGNAFAGFIFEPYLGYESFNITAQVIGSTRETSSTASGVMYGARLGYTLTPTIWMAGEYKGSSGSDKSDTATTNYTTTSTSLVFGYQNPRYRLWAGYNFADKLTFKTTPEMDLTGSGFKIGGGYKLSDKFYANVEILMPKLTKAKTTTGEVEIDRVYSKFTTTAVVISVSYLFGDK